MTLHVIKPGLGCTFQDLGRCGYQHLGVPGNGAMDTDAHCLANRLVGNPASQATLEMVLQGPELTFNVGTVIALAGADLGATLNGQALAPLHAVRVFPGARLAFGKRRHGARAYLAVRGGYVLPASLGSTSTNLRGGYGGLSGRALAKGDVVGIHSGFANPPRVLLPRPVPSAIDTDAQIRLVAGREWGLFSRAAHEALLNTPYRIQHDSDRMGYRLGGAALALLAPASLLSEAVGFGTVQVPPSGQPIVLMADRQTTGGYPKIAHVIAVDLPRLAQKLPGDTLRFDVVTLDHAQTLALAHSRWLNGLEAGGTEPPVPGV